ncbi:hypothetical protein AS026_28680 [Rhizobium altiplani]|uniref:HTH cro/C1-type domain-containing protein n=2 Tax=Rhizobium altiplani TaxID=1864509 RepID=A0A109K2C1_9HYPH|nr:hypothetical protein AS026_28680 [Rhizobium altiplani]
MRLPAPPEALRVARALTAFSQQEAAELAGVTRRYISTAETSEAMFNLNLQLIDFYTARGIEFLGQAAVGHEVLCAGARWRPPPTTTLLTSDYERYRTEDDGISFRGARALLNKTQADVAEEIGLSVATVKALERGGHWTDTSATMQLYFENQGVEFVGWGDASTRRYFGVGVRWKA